jgi:hypothetical protein
MHARIAVPVVLAAAFLLLPASVSAHHCAVTLAVPGDATHQGTDNTANVSVGQTVFVSVHGLRPGEAWIDWVQDGALVEAKARSIIVRGDAAPTGPPWRPGLPIVLGYTFEPSDAGQVTLRLRENTDATTVSYAGSTSSRFCGNFGSRLPLILLTVSPGDLPDTSTTSVEHARGDDVLLLRLVAGGIAVGVLAPRTRNGRIAASLHARRIS